MKNYGIAQIREAAETAYKYACHGSDPDYITRKSRLFVGRCIREMGDSNHGVSEDVAASVAWSALDDSCENIFWAHLRATACA